MNMAWYVGTSGYSYKEWCGPFYPEKTPAGSMLSLYAKVFNSVEINNTFYKTPEVATVEKWAGLVPSSFRFAVKASRRITHIKRLKEAGESADYFLERTAAFGPRMGCMLFQLPPTAKMDVERLQAFLGLLPPKLKAAFEFRHASWFSDAVYATLSKHNAAMVYSDGEAVEVPFISTANWGYLRLRDTEMDTKSLASWADRVRGQKWKSAYVFFKHEDEGRGPDFARQFVEFLGA